MRGHTLKYRNEEYIRVTVEGLKRDFETQISNLKKHHDEASSKWRKDVSLSNALEAAYHEELEQLKASFNDKAESIQQEVDSMINSNSERFKQHLNVLRSSIKELFKFINQSVVVLTVALLLRPEDFFE